MSSDFPHLPPPVNTILLSAPTYSSVSESMYKSLQFFFFPHRLFLGEQTRQCLEETRRMWEIIKTTQCQGVEESSADQRELWACRDRCFVRNRKRKEMGNALNQTLNRHLPGVSSFPFPPPLYNPAHKSLSRTWGAKDGDLFFPGLTQRGGDVLGLSAVSFETGQGHCTRSLSWPVKAPHQEKWFLSNHCQAAGWRGAHLSVSTLDSQCLTSITPALLLHATQQGLCKKKKKWPGAVERIQTGGQKAGFSQLLARWPWAS